MQHLSKLLTIDKSDLAWVLRLSLYGMRASLQEALKKNPSDPGISDCQELLKELTQLLEPSSSQVEQSQQALEPSSSQVEQSQQALEPSKKDVNNLDEMFFEPVSQPENLSVSSPKSELKLSHLRKAFMADSELPFYLGQKQLKSTSDEALWNEINRLLLRVPASLASAWQKQAQDLAKQVGASEDRQYLYFLPFNESREIYPGLSGTVKAQGLALSNRQSLDSRLTQGSLDGDLSFLAGVVSTYLAFIELDSSLHHALQSIDRFGVRALDSEQQKTKYSTALIDCFQRVQAAEASADPTLILTTRLDLDEAIHSLVYLPPVDRDSSWWGKLQQEARHTLIAKARQYQIPIRQLWGPYADIYNFSKHDLELDIGRTKGEVLACLRIYAKLNETPLPGRVLFRSLR